MVTSKFKKVVLYLLLPRPGAIIGGSVYFWGGVAYAVVLNRHFSIADIAVAWFCIEYLINQAKYWLNDYKDVASDRLHPRKKERASAGGYLPVKWLPVLCALRRDGFFALVLAPGAALRFTFAGNPAFVRQR